MPEAAPNAGSLPRGGSGEMFDRIAKRYDLLNRLISLGVDQRWRRMTVAALEMRGGSRILDLATGTGDLAIQIARSEVSNFVVGLDPSTNMLKLGRGKVEAGGLSERMELIEGDAQSLPFEADSFDGITMAFGIRNVPDRLQALREMGRVTRPGGRICILELSEPPGVMGALARWHMHVVVPALGALLSGSREYRYLPESIRAFPPPERFCALMEEAGLEVVRAVKLTFGVCQLYIAEAPSCAPGET